ncbi:hypothetical protein WJX77_007114 [Trebouxia sp. C0004]
MNHQKSHAIFKQYSKLELLRPGETRFATVFIMLDRMREGLSKRFFEIDSAVKEMTERAEAESRQTGQRVSPRKYAKIMDVERAEHGKSKDTGKPTPVASWVKTVLGPMRADKKGVCVCV